MKWDRLNSLFPLGYTIINGIKFENEEIQNNYDSIEIMSYENAGPLLVRKKNLTYFSDGSTLSTLVYDIQDNIELDNNNLSSLNYYGDIIYSNFIKGMDF